MLSQKSFFAFVFVFVTSFPQSYAATSSSSSASKPKPRTSSSSSSSSSKSSSSKALHINPHSLQSLLLTQNNSILQEVNKVYQAKENVNVARANLLPSLNLGTALNGGGFILSAVSFLLPFLMPSNWMNLRDNQKLLNAETSSYYILELNQYASAYAVYMTVLADQSLRATLETQYQNLKKIQDNVDLAVKLGLRPMTDLYQAEAQTELMANQVAQTDELLITETAAVRQMLALPLTQEIVFDSFHPSSVTYEGHSPSSLLPIALAKAPENQQLDYLIQAAQADRWSRIFSFFNGSTLSAGQNDQKEATLTHLTQGNSFNIGFAYFPNIALSNLNIQELELQKQAVSLSQAQILETTLGSLEDAKRELADAAESETNYQKQYDSELTEYNLGTTDLLHVLTAANSLETASMAKIKAQNDVDNLRITLNRTFLREYFSAIKPCETVQAPGGLFHRNPPASLDQVCKK